MKLFTPYYPNNKSITTNAYVSVTLAAICWQPTLKQKVPNNIDLLSLYVYTVTLCILYTGTAIV